MQVSRQSIRVRYNECDPMGLVHHSVYPVWFEMGRTEVCRETGLTYRAIEEAGAFFAITKLQVHYKAPVRYDDLIEVETSLERATRVKLEHAYVIRREDGLVTTTGATTAACIGRDGRPRALPEALLAKLESGDGDRRG